MVLLACLVTLPAGLRALLAGSRALPASFTPILALLCTIAHCPLWGRSQITSFIGTTEAEGTADHVMLLQLFLLLSQALGAIMSLSLSLSISLSLSLLLLLIFRLHFLLQRLLLNDPRTSFF